MNISLPKSKKMWAAIAAILVIVLNDQAFPGGLSPGGIEKIVMVVGAYMVGQGIADFGKEKAKIEIEAEKAASPTPPEAVS